jgi:very-short-patch-repair endonuclease
LRAIHIAPLSTVSTLVNFCPHPRRSHPRPVPKSPHQPPALRGKIFRGSAVCRSGLLTAAQLRSTAWRRLFRDVYADAHLPVTHQLRAWAVARHILPDEAAVAGRSAACLYGARLLDDDSPVEVLTARDFGPVAGLRIRRGPLPPEHLIRRADGIPVTSPERTCWDICRWLPVQECVAYLDALLGLPVLTSADLRTFVAARRDEIGWSRVAKATALTDAAAESPQESRLRVGLVLAGFPVPVSQYVLAVRGAFVARFDLAWPEYRVAVEYDGAWHADRDQLERDRTRLNRVLGAGWIVIHVTAARMRDDFPGIVRELRAALRMRVPS